MNTSKLFEVKNDLKRLQRNGDTLEKLLKGFDAKQNEQWAETVRKEIFQTEEAYVNAMEELREIQSFLYDA